MNDFLNDSIFNVESDLLVIPISTEGTISNSFRNGLEKLNISTEIWENRNLKLGEIKILHQQEINKYIAFVCTVDRYNSFYYAIRLIGKRLAEKIVEIGGVREIATPILGTGAGKLVPHLSLNIMRSAFYENRQAAGVRLTFCTLDEDILQSIREEILDVDTPSGQLVIEAEMPNIRVNELIEKIQRDKEFYFELAVEKFDEYVRYNPSDENFYTNLSQHFHSTKLPFKEFIKSEISGEQLKFTTLCGELIAYIDYNAYHKNIWNKYPDKRILAKASVRQNDCFLNLIKFKQTNDLSSLSTSIKNALKYLKSPDYNLTMLSINHRKEVYEKIFLNRAYSDEKFEETLFSFFRKLEINPRNPKNLGALYSRILYLPFIKPIWHETVLKESTFEENTEYIDLYKISTLIEECLIAKSKTLDLGNCGLNDLTIIPELFECTHIEKLILSNEWSEYENGKWRKLTSKNKGKRNNIQILPDSISELSELKVLICGGDWNEHKDKDWNRWGIKTLTSVSRLAKLEYLNLSNNRLNSLIGLNKLTNLKVAHLNNNEISRAEILNNLVHLEELYLSNNNIKSVKFIAGIPNVKTLDLHNNRIKDLKPIKNIIEKIGISNSKWEVGALNIAKNPLEQPPMTIVNLGKEAVLGVFEDIEKRGRYINKDVKVILVGNSEVGKSTLAKYLDKEIGLDQDHLPTLWMDEKIIKSKYSITTIGEECFLHVFDFGGHDYYHDTHHLFYTTNTIYILLWDQNINKLALRQSLQKRKNGEEVEIEIQDYPLKYWLDSVKFYTKDVEVDNFEFEINRDVTYNSSLLLIQNKVSDASKILFLDNEKLHSDYPFIYDIINISIKNPKRNLAHFDSLFSEMLNNMQIIGAILPKFYEPIKNSISSYIGKPILLFAEFLNHCNKILKEPINEDQCRRLLKYLEQVGVLLYINKANEEKIYIDKKWIIDNMHKILEKLTEEKGKFDMNYVIKILGTSNANISDVLMMMQEFKMIFKHPYSEMFIAPLYLPKTPDGKINLFLNKKQIPFRRFEYNGFIHKNVILSIFQKFGTLYPLDQNKDIYYYWKDGLIIKNPNTDEITMITFNLGDEDGNACIDIYELSKRDNSTFGKEVIEYIREVNQGYELEEMVTLDGVDYISKELLERNANIGKHIFSEKKLSDPQKSKKQEKLFKLKDYMNFIDNPVKKKKVVISYSKYDLDQVNLFIRYLRPLMDWDLIEEPWCCENLVTGEPWDEKIRSEFNKADIVFFMVSENLFSTKYIIENEIKDAIERYDKDNSSVKIVPIILEHYEWARKNPINLQRFSAMPFKGKPISDFNNPKIAWNTITQAVRIMIEKDISPEKNGAPNRETQEIYERQVKGKLDNNSN
ncbi:MAG: COR domain-containing protein [Bacteroides graminisolvens]|uniref:leucine-rich repeat domain-containing protein n=1 Tax=Bacteroides graminisolvens TaxID=477666 RepID=UPI003A8898C8